MDKVATNNGVSKMTDWKMTDIIKFPATLSSLLRSSGLIVTVDATFV